MFYVYLLHNTINNKVYVGKSKNVLSRVATHKRIAYSKSSTYEKYAIHYAIEKYGFENFKTFTVEASINEEEIFRLEIEWISLLKQCRYKLYNLTNGGEGVSGKIYDDIYRAKLSASHMGQKAWNKGVSPTKEVLKKLSQSHLGQKAWNKGIPMDKSVKNKISGENNGVSKLSHIQINEIRLLLSKPDRMTYKAIGKLYCVSKETIRRISLGKTYTIY